MNSNADLGPFLTSLNRERISEFPLQQKCLSKGYVNDAATSQARCVLLLFYLTTTQNRSDGANRGLFIYSYKAFLIDFLKPCLG